MSTPSLYEMLTFSFSGELPLEQISERDQLILSVMDNMQRIIVNAKIIGRFSPFLMSAIGH